ncbi:MAG: hypothetical protein AVDCRST_MAG41-2664, partial [uncultured Corynebacteriales bacterium]
APARVVQDRVRPGRRLGSGGGVVRGVGLAGARADPGRRPGVGVPSGAGPALRAGRPDRRVRRGRPALALDGAVAGVHRRTGVRAGHAVLVVPPVRAARGRAPGRPARPEGDVRQQGPRRTAGRAAARGGGLRRRRGDDDLAAAGRRGRRCRRGGGRRRGGL